LIETAFPMGSMTGVPKIRAMEIADESETFRRELYSGTVGYFDGPKRLDLNVVIRSFLWNAESGLLSFSTGGAITIRSDADQEYDECLLKAEALIQCLKELNK
jgi:para-aminobenzoate synthetase component 1